ncbi:MAG: hypothetical protein ACTHU0_37925 [Kofleriaceae bacterium]
MSENEWTSVTAEVAEVNAGVLPVLLDMMGAAREGQQSTASYFLGDIEWYPDPSLDIIAYNTGDVENMLYWTDTSPEGAATKSILIPAGAAYVMTRELDEYKEGQVTVGRVASAPDTKSLGVGAGGVMRTVCTCLKYLSLATAVSIVGGIVIEVTPNGRGGYQLIVRAVGGIAKLALDWAISGAGGTGASGSAAIDFQQPNARGVTATGEYVIPVPSGVKLDPIVQQLDLRLQVDESVLAQAAAEQGGRLIAGRPPRAGHRIASALSR